MNKAVEQRRTVTETRVHLYHLLDTMSASDLAAWYNRCCAGERRADEYMHKTLVQAPGPVFHTEDGNMVDRITVIERVVHWVFFVRCGGWQACETLQ